MKEKQNAALGTAPLGRLMLKFALPCTVSLLVGALYNIVDQIFIGWGVGYLGNGATNVVFPLTVLALGLAVMIGDGACSYVSICFGKNQPENANRAVGSAVALSVLVGIAVAVLYAVFQMPLLTLFGATEANFGYAKEYFTCITIGIPIYVFGQAINPIIRSDGSPQFAMLSMLAGAIANCILDPIAIFVLHWGVMGAAAATVAGQVITAAMGVWYLFHTKALRLKADDFKLRGRILGAYLPLGLCSFLAQISLVIAMAATNNMLVQYGASSKYGADIPLTVLGIVMKVFQIIISITIGMAAGCIPIVGYNYGAQLLRRCRGVLWRLMGAEFLLGVLALLLLAAVIRTLCMKKKTSDYTPHPDAAREREYAEKLSRMVAYETVSHPDDPELEKFRGFPSFLNPLLQQACRVRRTGEIRAESSLPSGAAADGQPVVSRNHWLPKQRDKGKYLMIIC